MNQSLYTEKDLQDYACGTFTGNKRLLEDFISKDEFAKKQVAYYKTLHLLLKEEKIPALSAGFAGRVAALTETSRQKAESNELIWKHITVCGLIIIFIITIVFTVKYWIPIDVLSFSKYLFFWVCAVAVTLFTCLFSYAEIKRRKRIFKEFASFL